MNYRERLWVPILWWLLAGLLVLSVWLALIVAAPIWLTWLVSAGVGGLCGIALLTYGRTQVRVTEQRVYAGRAQIEHQHISSIEALNKDQTRAALGANADARAFLVTKPYLSRCVKLCLNDARDPTPYWLIGSRRPDQLAQAIRSYR